MKNLSIFVLLLLSFFSYANNSLPTNRHISIVGTAQLKVKPDIAVVYFEVESLKVQSLAAKKDVDDRINYFLDGLAQFNIDEQNVSASSITTSPSYSYTKDNQKRLDGHLARRNIKITLKEIERLNELMDFALSAKIDQIRNIEFRSSNADSFKDEVNVLAVNNAKEKGHSLAKAFDAQLGKIYSINASSNNIRNRYGANHDVERVEAAAAHMNKFSQPGQYLQESIIFSASISVVFDLDAQ